MLPQLKAELSKLNLNSYYLSPYGANRNYATEHLEKQPFPCVLWFCIKTHHLSNAPPSPAQTCAPRAMAFPRSSGMSRSQSHATQTTASAVGRMDSRFWSCVYLLHLYDANSWPIAYSHHPKAPSCCMSLPGCAQVPQHLPALLSSTDRGWGKRVTCSGAGFLHFANNYNLAKALKSVTPPDSIYWHLLP